MQQFGEHRPYPYDDRASSYAMGHSSHHASEYTLTTPAYPHYDTSGFYSSSAIGGIDSESQACVNRLPVPTITVVAHTSSFYRSMTPSLSNTRYPSTPRDARYHSSEAQSILASSHNTSSLYSPDSNYFASTYGSNNEARAQFIPTPSEMSNSYSNYAIVSRSPPSLGAERYGSPTAYPSHLATTNHVRPRISTNRPRSGTLGSSPTASPSGERFPCEKCGKTFSRSHDRKRHHETQHLATPIIHRCRWCEKEFSRCVGHDLLLESWAD